MWRQSNSCDVELLSVSEWGALGVLCVFLRGKGRFGTKL